MVIIPTASPPPSELSARPFPTPYATAATKALHRSPCLRPEPLPPLPDPLLPHHFSTPTQPLLSRAPALSQPLPPMSPGLCRRLPVGALVQCCSHCSVLLAPSREPWLSSVHSPHSQPLPVPWFSRVQGPTARALVQL